MTAARSAEVQHSAITERMGSRSVSKSRSLYRSLESICKSLVLRSTHDSIDRRELYSLHAVIFKTRASFIGVWCKLHN
jgi:hypothetical protein